MDIHLISIEISIEGCTCTLIEPKGIPFVYTSPKCHNRYPMEGRLSIEQHNITILDMPLNCITDLQRLSEESLIPESQVSL